MTGKDDRPVTPDGRPWLRIDTRMHRGGVPWDAAPLPSLWHRCQVQTTAVAQNGTVVERCACGALREGCTGPWIWRNSRRRLVRFVDDVRRALARKRPR